jgi:TPP-dependent 2-oxoacid decarboxylase
MHFARAEKSARLRRLIAFLGDGKEHSTLDVAMGAVILNVGTYVSELNHQGYHVETTLRIVDGQRRWFYRMDGKPAVVSGQ